jgi:hypothetical protein
MTMNSSNTEGVIFILFQLERRRLIRSNDYFVSSQPRTLVLERPGSTDKSFGLVDEPIRLVRWVFGTLFVGERQEI